MDRMRAAVIAALRFPGQFEGVRLVRRDRCDAPAGTPIYFDHTAKARRNPMAFEGSTGIVNGRMKNRIRASRKV
jgi:hypothetical protein